MPLLSILIAILVFGVVAVAMYLVCTRFLGRWPQALWICGGILLLVLIYYVASQAGVSGATFRR
jgi:hypothetical protein